MSEFQSSKYRKRPVVIEAAKTGIDFERDLEIMAWCGGEFTDEDSEFLFTIPTMEGDLGCPMGAFVIKSVQGEFYACDAEIFELTYEEV